MKCCLRSGKQMEKFLRSKGYEVLVLTDGRRHNPIKGLFARVDPVKDYRWPTKINVIKAIDWLMLNALPGDLMFLYFAGHGSSTPGSSMEGLGAYSETIWALDDVLTNRLLYTLITQRVPPNAHINVLFDSCHSGSALDLPFAVDTYGGLHLDRVRPFILYELEAAHVPSNSQPPPSSPRSCASHPVPNPPVSLRTPHTTPHPSATRRPSPAASL